MSKRQDTVDDIIAEKRRRAEEIERDVAEKMKRGEMTSDQYARELVADIRREADRLEAACKRDKAAIEADALAVGGMVEAAHEREMSKNASKNVADFGQLGDAAKLRAALVSVKKSIDEMGAASLDGEPEIMLMSLTQVCARLSARIDDALAAPPRNCDVGTAEEQDKRFAYQFCRVGIEGCIRCKLDTLKHRGNTCGIHWAQMPYEKGDGK